MSVARPVWSSASTMTAFSRGLPVAVSNRAGMPFRNRPSAALDLDADDRVVRARHADVGEIRRALRQNPLVGRLHVRVRADDGRDLAVEVPAHRDFLGRGFGVEVDEDDRASAAAAPRPRAATTANGSSMFSMKTRPIDVDDADAHAVARARDVAAVARYAGGVVGRPEQPRLDADVVDRFLLVPDVVARRHHVDAAVEQLLADLARDAESGRRILGIRDHADRSAWCATIAANAAPHEFASGPADDVADEEEARSRRRRRSAARESRIAAAAAFRRSSASRRAARRPTSVARGIGCVSHGLRQPHARARSGRTRARRGESSIRRACAAAAFRRRSARWCP